MSDLSVQWLLQAYLASMQRDARNIYVFPVSINYERLFEIRNIADMMVSSDARNMGIFDIKRKFDAFKGHSLGRVYVKFGKTISLRDYFAGNEKGVLTANTLNDSALNLTQRLVVEHHLASPVFLNNVVASLILHHNEESYPLKDLVRDCQTLYLYFKIREIDTIMTQKPTQKSVESVLAGLGYTVKAP
jgi:glycerol-3-phosphate O-acyltransferase